MIPILSWLFVLISIIFYFFGDILVLILVDNLNNIILLFVFYVDNLITIIFYSKYFSYKISEQRKVLSYSKENSMVQI